MTETIDGLPETILYGGHEAEYAGTTTFKASGQLWYRHEYAYVNAPHIIDRVYFFRVEGDDEPIPEVTEFELSRDREPRRPPQRRSTKSIHQPATFDRAAASEKMHDVLSYLDERRKDKADKRPPIDLTRLIRNQVKPFGDE